MQDLEEKMKALGGQGSPPPRSRTSFAIREARYLAGAAAVEEERAAYLTDKTWTPFCRPSGRNHSDAIAFFGREQVRHLGAPGVRLSSLLVKGDPGWKLAAKEHRFFFVHRGEMNTESSYELCVKDVDFEGNAGTESNACLHIRGASLPSRRGATWTLPGQRKETHTERKFVCWEDRADIEESPHAVNMAFSWTGKARHTTEAAAVEETPAAYLARELISRALHDERHA
ncbi:hypothetical protein MTO96_047865 [Rhipicephalus appendiculatus]